MTAYAPDPQDTTGPFTAPVTAVLDTLARHRRTAATAVTPPGWFLIAMTLTAGTTAAAAWVLHSLPLMLLALLYAVVALGVDVAAALHARRDGDDD